MNFRVIAAISKRNFLGYFSNPTGYVFICVFVLLSAIAAFLPDEFFNANLANLDQLNTWFPLIMLVFVPAITMGIWADERRQGTDELLLTLPADDTGIVLGKYLAAVGIFSVSLIFSLFCNLLVLRGLGNPDLGLFLCTYLGYWLIGLALLSIGMVASFLTGNLTVAYILGAIFCVPLVILQWAEIAPVPTEAAAVLRQFSIGERFAPFGRGIVSLSNLVYFAMIICTMLYLCIILIGRRHWSANQTMLGAFHFTVRVVSLFIIGLSCCFIISRFDARYDMTSEKLSTLSPETVALLKNLDPEHPVIIEAFLSPELPKNYVQTKLDIEAVLREFESICGNKVSVRIHNKIRPNTQEALTAAQRFDIRPREVWFLNRGARDRKRIFMGVTFRTGLKTLTLPFLDRGLSMEYELTHALCNIVQPEKKRVGILRTDAQVFGGMDYSTFSENPTWTIVEELRKQYTVVEVDPKDPIVETFDALLVVQPSSLGAVELPNLVDALRRGQPAVIFEDPMPIFNRQVPGTSDPRQAGQMMMMMGRAPEKGDITLLWELLGVAFDGTQIAWQNYNPIPKLGNLPHEFVFVDRAQGKDSLIPDPFNAENAISADIQYMMFPFPGIVLPSAGPDSKIIYTPLVQTNRSPAGRISALDFRRVRSETELPRLRRRADAPMDLAVFLAGELPPQTTDPGTLEPGQTPPRPEAVPLNVVLIADTDMIANGMFQMRAQGNEPGVGINIEFDNVTFVLNAIDRVAGDERFLAIRGRRPIHRTLEKFDGDAQKIRDKADILREELQQAYDKQVEDEQEKFDRQTRELRDRYQTGQAGLDETMIRINAQIAAMEKRILAAKERAERQLNTALEKADVELNKDIRSIQAEYKFRAVLLPPIPPLVIGLCVFVSRRLRERESVPKTRRTK